MFPDYLDGAKVLLYTDMGHWGFITDYDENNTAIECEIFYQAICQYIGDDRFYLLSCDRDFDVIADVLFDSADIAEMCNYESENTAWHKKSAPHLYTAAQRKTLGGTCYFEFQYGRFRHKHWLGRSVYMHAEVFDALNLFELFTEAIPEFDYFGVTEVTPKQYEKLRELAKARGGEVDAVFAELDSWTKNCFLTENVFSVLGI